MGHPKINLHTIKSPKIRDFYFCFYLFFQLSHKTGKSLDHYGLVMGKDNNPLIAIIEELKKQVIANLLERNVFILDLLGKTYWRYYRIENKIEKWGAQ